MRPSHQMPRPVGRMSTNGAGTRPRRPSPHRLRPAVGGLPRARAVGEKRVDSGQMTRARIAQPPTLTHGRRGVRAAVGVRVQHAKCPGCSARTAEHARYARMAIAASRRWTGRGAWPVTPTAGPVGEPTQTDVQVSRYRVGIPTIKRVFSRGRGDGELPPSEGVAAQLDAEAARLALLSRQNVGGRREVGWPHRSRRAYPVTNPLTTPATHHLSSGDHRYRRATKGWVSVDQRGQPPSPTSRSSVPRSAGTSRTGGVGVVRHGWVNPSRHLGKKNIPVCSALC